MEKEYFDFDNANRVSSRKKTVTAETNAKPHVVIGEEIFVDLNREQNSGTDGSIGNNRKNKRVLPEVE